MIVDSIIRLTSVVAVILIVALGWSRIGAARLKKKGVEESKAKSEAKKSATKYSLIAAFLYMVAMVSVAGLFM